MDFFTNRYSSVYMLYHTRIKTDLPDPGREQGDPDGQREQIQENPMETVSPQSQGKVVRSHLDWLKLGVMLTVQFKHRRCALPPWFGTFNLNMLTLMLEVMKIAIIVLVFIPH